jgi:hypothetical protein
MEENEKKIEMTEIELEFDEKTVDYLLKHAKENIINDNEALINWAANDILREMVDNRKKHPLTEVEEHHLIKKIKELENGKSNS